MTDIFGIPATTIAGYMAGAVGAIVLALLLFAAVNRILLRMALRNIPRRRAQSVLILFGLMLATLIITASLAVGDTSSYSLQAIEVRQIGGMDAAFTRPGTNTIAGVSIVRPSSSIDRNLKRKLTEPFAPIFGSSNTTPRTLITRGLRHGMTSAADSVGRC